MPYVRVDLTSYYRFRQYHEFFVIVKGSSRLLSFCLGLSLIIKAITIFGWYQSDAIVSGWLAIYVTGWLAIYLYLQVSS